LKSKKPVMYILMTILVISWGLDYVAAKICLYSLDTVVLLFLRYALAFSIVFIVKMIFERKVRLRLSDIPLFLLCAITGELGYFYLEYSAMDHLPISLLTLILACVPVVSLLIEKLFLGRRITALMALGVIGSLLGVGMIIGADLDTLLEGRLIGYLLAFGAVLSWNAYNFMTARLCRHYPDTTLSFYQITCTTLLALPYAATHAPSLELFTGELVAWLLFLGVFSAGLGFIIYVRAIGVLGVTPASLFSNFLPISTTLFGWLFFNEMILPAQIAGGILIIASACLVIWEKGRVDAGADAPEPAALAPLMGRQETE